MVATVAPALGGEMHVHAHHVRMCRTVHNNNGNCVERKMPKYVVAGSEGCMVTLAVILCELWAVVPMT